MRVRLGVSTALMSSIFKFMLTGGAGNILSSRFYKGFDFDSVDGKTRDLPEDDNGKGKASQRVSQSHEYEPNMQCLQPKRSLYPST